MKPRIVLVLPGWWPSVGAAYGCGRGQLGAVPTTAGGWLGDDWATCLAEYSQIGSMRGSAGMGARLVFVCVASSCVLLVVMVHVATCGVLCIASCVPLCCGVAAGRGLCLLGLQVAQVA